MHPIFVILRRADIWGPPYYKWGFQIPISPPPRKTPYCIWWTGCMDEALVPSTWEQGALPGRGGLVSPLSPPPFERYEACCSSGRGGEVYAYCCFSFHPDCMIFKGKYTLFCFFMCTVPVPIVRHQVHIYIQQIGGHILQVCNNALCPRKIAEINV